jgi:hypothetical protein
MRIRVVLGFDRRNAVLVAADREVRAEAGEAVFAGNDGPTRSEGEPQQ